MKISAVNTKLVSIPLQGTEIDDSQTVVKSVDFLQVELVTDSGIRGYGMNWSYTPGLGAAKTSVDHDYAPLLVGADPLQRKQLHHACYFSNHFVGRVGAALVGLAAVDFALWDIACKLQGLPLWRYLGPCRNEVKAYSTDGGWLSFSETELVRKATELVERGFDAVKLKLGRPDPGEDLRRVQAVRSAVGPRIRIMTDVNCAWSLGTAKAWGARLAEHDVFWLEEPMHPFDKKSHALLAKAITTPIALGETVYTKYDFRDFLEAGAIDIVQADVTKLSGIDEWLEVAALASAYGKPVVPHTNVQQKLHVQLAAATAGVMMVESCYESFLEIWEEPIYVRDGFYSLPEQPGLGLKLRDEVVRAHRVA